ncbi:alpha/beta family hydrolase [Luteococcus peritonei]|uniref:Alpha/beta family hydrolase n=1 Tax=Luteococcus peritonei TaxID=88874 RepID=A0ABW4RZR9_9ACTN
MSSAEQVLDVETAQGPSRLVVDGELGAGHVLLLGHGAGGGADAPDLVALARHLPEQGICVVRYEQPWRTAGRRIAPAPKRLDEAWTEAAAVLRERLDPAVELVLGGRSAGARVACRTASGLGAVGVLALAFPLHPPGRPEKSRAAELLGSGLPTLVVQGGRDPFGSAQEVREVAARAGRIRVAELEQAGHELTVGQRAVPGTEELWVALAEQVARFVLAPGSLESAE